jgi:7-carboxy-7-deazaguanine synthase
MHIAEIFASLQGEGLLTGTPSVFVRTSGCNLRCWFCDTPYTSWQPEGEDWSIEAIVKEVERLCDGGQTEQIMQAAGLQPVAEPIRHVVLTGGEPMLFAELVPLCERLKSAGLHITIETAGTLHLSVKCDLMSLSPKLANSTPPAERAGRWTTRHEQTRQRPPVIRRLTSDYDYQLKFIIDSPADLPDVSAWLAEFPHLQRRRVLLMPQGTDATLLAQIGAWLAPYCAEHGYTFCPRKHIEWFGARRGT